MLEVDSLQNVSCGSAELVLRIRECPFPNFLAVGFDGSNYIPAQICVLLDEMGLEIIKKPEEIMLVASSIVTTPLFSQICR